MFGCDFVARQFLAWTKNLRLCYFQVLAGLYSKRFATQGGLFEGFQVLLLFSVNPASRLQCEYLAQIRDFQAPPVLFFVWLHPHLKAPLGFHFAEVALLGLQFQSEFLEGVLSGALFLLARKPAFFRFLQIAFEKTTRLLPAGDESLPLATPH